MGHMDREDPTVESSRRAASTSSGPGSSSDNGRLHHRTALLLSLASFLGSVSRCTRDALAGLAAVVALAAPAFAQTNSPTISLLADQFRVGEVVRTRVTNWDPAPYLLVQILGQGQLDAHRYSPQQSQK